MADEKWSQVKEIFDAVLRRKPEERSAFLDDACDGDNAVRIEVESLLSSFGRADGFMQTPLVGGAGEEPTIRKETLAAGDSLGHCEIVRVLGIGGMGEVYLAKDKKLDRHVAIKVLNQKFEKHETNLQRFLQEAKAASALNHPNILVIHEVGETDDAHYIVSEYVEGKTLREHLEGKNLPLAEALDISIQIGKALAAAHTAHIVHRDIKPENIMIRPDGLTKVLDFGLAKLVEQKNISLIGLDDETVRKNQTEKGVILGTVSYMSPEQARGKRVDERTDIFSFGVLIYEMITGRTPFAADSMSETFANLINKEPLPLSRFSSGVPDELQRIVSKMLRKNTDDRYQTMKGLLADLKELKERITIQGKLDRMSSPEAQQDTAIMTRTTGDVPISAGRIIVPWYRRALLAILPVLLLGTIAFAWYWLQPSTPTQPEIRSLAVLPLKSIDASDDSLGLGLADSIIRRLSSTGTVIVRPTSAVRRYLNEEADSLSAAAQLKTDAVLEGTLQRADERLRVSVNLIRTSDGASLWNDNFDLRFADIFSMQDTISQKVAASLQLRLDPAQRTKLGKRHTSNPEAYENFVKGRAFREQGTTAIGNMQPMESAIGYFKRATELDQQFGLAHAALGEAYMWVANFNDPKNPAWVNLAQQTLAKAESIDPNLAEIHTARWEYYYSRYGGWDISRAAKEARLAKTLDPNVGHTELGALYDHIGFDETAGIAEFRNALEVDPTNVSRQSRLVESLRLYGRYNEANAENQKFFGEPNAWALVLLGRIDEAEGLLESAAKKSPGDLVNRSFIALAKAMKGRSQEAEVEIAEILKDAPENRAYHHITYNFACAYAVTGKAPEAVKWLRVTAETGMPNYPLFVRDKNLDKVRDSTEFKQFLAEVKETWEGYRKEIENSYLL